ncbi:MAG: hypothetical protein CVT77_03295 [Alphaproteobacteria bacterium HGW-Alphaproteobacteria-16]|nr:MAG: hypothetical protein CVT77_03295 [Alphaproteobacteria bacterium HGW-Alphaproteobacteria-16]
MKRFNSALFLASVASMALASAASAQSIIPGPVGPNDTDGALHGAGATSVQNILVQELNCIGGNNPLLTETGGSVPIAEPTALTTPAGTFNCSTQELQPNFEAKYVGTGSGFGRQSWRNRTEQFTATGRTVLGGPWNTVQFAFADSSITAGDITDYNNATTGAATLGVTPIMFPKYVLPVAIAYNPIYGRNTTTSTDYTFRVNPAFSAATTQIGGVNVGGLRLTRDLYCGILNGQITNWNHPDLQTANGNQSLGDPADPRWAAQGAPIRLVGRLDRSGTTDLYTRALAAQCNSVPGVTNRYTLNAETLPYNSSSGVNFVTERPDTGLRPGGGTTAGTFNLVGREWFNPASGGSILVSASSSGTAPSSNPNAANGNGSGLFLVASGSGAVRDAINFAPDFATTANPNILLNGKVGYISSDYVANSPTGSATLFAAALENANNSTFNLPSAANSSASLTAIAPPQAAANGAFQLADTRLVRNPAGGANIQARRANPLAWYDVLYPTPTTGLANPAAGYPFSGTTQVLAHQCYKATNRPFVVNFLGWNTDAVTRDSANANRTGIFTNASTGLLALSNIGTLPQPWRRAVNQTFLTDSNETNGGQRLGDLNLWIQSLPTPAGTANATACAGATGI